MSKYNTRNRRPVSKTEVARKNVENSLALIYSYLKRRQQSVRINNTYSSFQNIVSGVPQGSILGPIIFNFFIHDLLLFVKKAEVYNYADDNTLAHRVSKEPFY